MLRLLRIPVFKVFLPRGPILPFARPFPLVRSPRSPTHSIRLSRRPHSNSPPRTPSPTTDTPPPTSLTGRLKSLIKTHGWYALGVYFGLSLLDFSLTFAVIYLVGAEQVNKLTGGVRSTFSGLFHKDQPPVDPTTDKSVEASGSEGLYAMAILAYGIHKTLWFPVRIGLTAAITPRFVNFLTARGFVGRGGVRRAALHVKDKMQVNGRANSVG
ncbi:hypothetical protein BS47DRAFT_83710 [Hydnum rufescens UP504]|uniref:DUF1279 domain-containing protein n=1 Tax=Hydnum rufescens UP504 TaxID=1448309 RepID=A0A9P6B897_9AGAM|nr:hypothetical protein BS47DRAFT_83710 [Hydnum rufescens UP504]